MSLVSNIVGTINKYGRDVRLINGDTEILTGAFIEPLRYKNKIYIGGEYRNLKGTDRYLYVGKPKLFKLKEGETLIEESGIKYLVERTESYIVNDEVIYDWAIIKSLWS